MKHSRLGGIHNLGIEVRSTTTELEYSSDLAALIKLITPELAI